MGFAWGRECDPRSTPLKKNALGTLIPSLSKLGFATGPVQRRKSFIRLPIYWIYSLNRNSPPYRYYEPVGAVRIPCLDQFDKMTFDYTETCQWICVFGQFFDKYLQPWEPFDLFSSEGLSEIRRFVNAVRSCERCPEPAKILRYAWVARHSELWDDPACLLRELRRYGLYSSSTPDSQAIEHIIVMVENIKQGRLPRGPIAASHPPASIPKTFGGEEGAVEYTDEDLLKLISDVGEKFRNMPKRNGRGPTKHPFGSGPGQ